MDQALDKAFRIIEDHFEVGDFTGPISDDKIEIAEAMLGLTFPGSYRLFVKRYGCGGLFGEEIYGIVKDPSTDGNRVPNGIWLTTRLRDEFGLDPQYLVIASTGYGPYVVIATSENKPNGECPIYLWQGECGEKISNDFAGYLLAQLEEGKIFWQDL